MARMSRARLLELGWTDAELEAAYRELSGGLSLPLALSRFPIDSEYIQGVRGQALADTLRLAQNGQPWHNPNGPKLGPFVVDDPETHALFNLDTHPEGPPGFTSKD
jgi:hypothetical protein